MIRIAPPIFLAGLLAAGVYAAGRQRPVTVSRALLPAVTDTGRPMAPALRPAGQPAGKGIDRRLMRLAIGE